MESYNSNVDKSKNKLFKDSEFISQTKKQFILLGWEIFLHQKRFLKN